jgi:hypothetical protein
MQTPYMIDNALFQVYRRPFRPLAPSGTAPRPHEPSMCQALCRCSHADLAPHLHNHGHVTHVFACYGMSDTCPMHGMLCSYGATVICARARASASLWYQRAILEITYQSIACWARYRLYIRIRTTGAGRYLGR